MRSTLKESGAVVLLSGGLDSATVLAMAQAAGHRCVALSFRYGQRHAVELDCAREVARAAGVHKHQVVDIDLRAFGGSALTDDAFAVPAAGADDGQVPITYVPARNTIFLSFAVACAEVSGANHIYIGANAVDYSGYPDCREPYLRAFETMANLGTRAGGLHIDAPIVHLSKADIIRTGHRLGVNYALTWSCYDPQPHPDGPHACGRCDSCAIRRRGFHDAGVPDPTRYQGTNHA
jgi:7-cyano-7-deazaguanine synthase